MLMLTDRLEWWARRFGNGPEQATRKARDAAAADRSRSAAWRDERGSVPAPRTGRFDRRPLGERPLQR